MKKITNNASWGKLSIIFNILILVFFIISMVFLMKFDKVNLQFVEAVPVYQKSLENLRIAEQPTRADSVTVAHYQYRVDTLRARPVPTNRKDAQALTSEIERVNALLQEKIEIRDQHDSIVQVRRASFSPIESKYNTLEEEMLQSRKTFNIILTIFIILMVVKIFMFAFWSYKNANNVRQSARWAKKATAPFWAFLGWLIPVYNLVKPYSFTSEFWNDTEYLLKDRNILPESYDKKDNNDFYMGLWWGFFLVSLLGLLFIWGTFFTTGPLFIKLSHFNVMLVVTICWLIYLALESLVIIRYNQLNKLMADNESKFQD